VDLNIVAHQDDDILFMNPDILNAVVAGHRQVTVFITGGNTDEDGQAYALEREEGAIAGYSKLLQLADAKKGCPNHFDDFMDVFQGDSQYPAGCPSPTPTDTMHCFACVELACELSTAGDARGQRGQMKIGSRTLNVATIGDGPDGPRVLLIFLRVQTPCELWGNNECPTRVDLHELLTSPNHKLQIRSAFNQPGYTRQQLITQLVQILQLVQPDVLRTQDTADGHNVDFPHEEMITNNGCNADPNITFTNPQFYDHSDHVAGARFAREALKVYDKLLNVKLPTYSIYMGYNLEWNQEATNPPRVTTADFCLKKSIFFRYGLHDSALTQNSFDCFYYWYIGYQQSVSVTPLP
jgi:LmbE family N-acetylglucosaminyl deacetylase